MLVLGGTGYAGLLIAKLLLERTDCRITLASRHLARGQAVAADLGAPFVDRVSACRADAGDPDSLRAAFRGHDLVVVAAPTTAHADKVVRAALDERVDYLDIQLGAAKLALLRSLAGEIESRGRWFVTEAGFHPGLPAALVRYAADQLDRLETANVITYLNQGADLPYTDAVDELAEVFRHYQGQAFRGGGWTRPTSWTARRFDLGRDIGRKLCYSMYYEELGPLPATFPSLTDLGCYVSESHWVTDWLITPIVGLGLKFPRSTHAMGRLFWWSLRTFARPPHRVEIQVQATGIREGRQARVRVSVAHDDGYAITAIPVVATLLQYLDGSVRKPGLWLMGHVVDPVRLVVRHAGGDRPVHQPEAADERHGRGSGAIPVDHRQQQDVRARVRLDPPVPDRQVDQVDPGDQVAVPGDDEAAGDPVRRGTRRHAQVGRVDGVRAERVHRLGRRGRQQALPVPDDESPGEPGASRTEVEEVGHLDGVERVADPQASGRRGCGRRSPPGPGCACRRRSSPPPRPGCRTRGRW